MTGQEAIAKLNERAKIHAKHRAIIAKRADTWTNAMLLLSEAGETNIQDAIDELARRATNAELNA